MKEKLFCLSILIVMLLSSTLFSQTKFIPYQQLPDYNGSTSGSGMYFSASMNSSIITITFEGPANKWIALGLGTSMQPTDVFIYTVGQGSATHPVGWYDYYNSSYNSSGVVLDATQNWSIVSTSTVSGGQRTVTASRVLNTGDPSDVSVSYTASSLDLVWARGSSSNYTIAYHGSTNRANGISLPWLSSPTASFSASSQTICQGSNITYSNQSTGGQTSYTWSFPGGNPASSTATNPVVSYTAAGLHSVVLTAANAIGSNTFSQINYITVTPTVVPSLTINLSGGTSPICSGATATFTANPTNGGNSPGFQWKINGSNAGSNSPTFTTNTLANSNTVTCVLLSNQTCANPTSAVSAGITMTVNSSAPSSVSIVQTAGNNPLCLGSTVGFSASPFNGGSNPTYQWKVNGTNVGLNSPTFTTNSLSNGDLVSCVLNSNDPCTVANTATSSVITMTVSTLLTPSVSIAVSSPSGTLCSGTLLNFTANPVNGGSSPVYQWNVNGSSVGTNSAGFSSSSLNNNDVVSCVLISALSCASPSSVSSTPLSLNILQTPSTPSISVFGSTLVCPGQEVLLSSSAPSNNVWSNGAITSTASVSGAGTYSLIVVANSCSSTPATISITEHPVVQASIDPVGVLCVQSDPVVLTGQPAGGQFSGSAVQSGVFQPSLASTGSGNLVVYTSQQQFGSATCTDTSSVLLIVNDCTNLGEHAQENTSALLFPNPSDVFTLKVSNGSILSVHIVDLNGKAVPYTSKGNDQEKQLTLENCPGGIYFLYVDTETQRYHFHLMVQQR